MVNLSKITLAIALITLIIVIVSLLIPRTIEIGEDFVMTTTKLGKDGHPGFQIAQKLDDGTLKPLIRGNKVEGVTIYGGNAHHQFMRDGTHSPMTYGEYTIQSNDYISNGNFKRYTYHYNGSNDGEIRQLTPQPWIGV